MSEASSLPAPKEPTRLERRGYQPKTARKPIVELNAEQRLFLEYTLHGCSKPDLCEQVGVKPCEPMSIEQAADLCRIRRRFARWLFEQTAFKRAYASGLEAIRNGYRVKALQTQGEIMQDAGDGSAAFAAVRLKAATALLGDESKGNASVNIAVNTAINLQPGVVVRLPADAPAPPLETQAKERGDIIDITPIRQRDAPEGFSIDPAAEAAMARSWPNTVGGDAD